MPELTAHDFERIADGEIEKLRKRLSDPKNISITMVTEFMIVAGYPNHMILPTIKRHFAGCRTTASSIKSERARMRRSDAGIPTSTAAHYQFMAARSGA